MREWSQGLFGEEDPLAHRGRTTPERLAVIETSEDECLTYRELDRLVDTVTPTLAGRTVATLLDTGLSFATVLLASLRTDGTLVPLNTSLSETELSARLDRVDPDVLLCSEATAATARSVADCPVSGVADIDDPTVGGEPMEVDLLMFTSGTTGRPKGVRLTRGNLYASAIASAFRLGVDPTDRWLVCLPMYHMGGLAPVVRSTLYGTPAVIQPSFDAGTTADVIDDHDVTTVSLVPTMCKRLLDAGWEPPERLRAVLLGGAAASGSLIERALDRSVPVYPTYGATETASQVATATPAQVAADPETVGQPLAFTEVRIVDDDGSDCDPGETGELVVDGPTVAEGYLDPDRSTSAFDEKGFHTGDLAHADADGRLWIHGRADDRIVTGGENVDPETVAAAIRSLDGVADAAVVGLPDPEWGERVAALVAGGVSSEAVLERCRERLADFEVPKTVAVVDSLPRTASGTVDREAVRERLSAND